MSGTYQNLISRPSALGWLMSYLGAGARALSERRRKKIMKVCRFLLFLKKGCVVCRQKTFWVTVLIGSVAWRQRESAVALPWDPFHCLLPPLPLGVERSPVLDSIAVSVFVDIGWVGQILRRLRRPLPRWCRIYWGPQLSDWCLKVPFFYWSALPSE